jgi:hypothetical protein
MDRFQRLTGTESITQEADETLVRTEKLLVRARTIGQGLELQVGRLLGKEQAMSEQMLSERTLSEDSLLEPRRKAIFLALVEAQDHKMSVAQSRLVIAERFGISERQVREIEREGLDNCWPPLDEAG